MKTFAVGECAPDASPECEETQSRLLQEIVPHNQVVQYRPLLGIAAGLFLIAILLVAALIAISKRKR